VAPADAIGQLILRGTGKLAGMAADAPVYAYEEAIFDLSLPPIPKTKH
jgi:hypothetical protein